MHKHGYLARYRPRSKYKFTITPYFLLILLKHTAPIISAAQLKTSSGFSACEKLVDEFRLVSHRLNAVLQHLDPPAFESHKALREAICREHPVAKAQLAIDPYLGLGRSVIFNRQTPNHIDRRDPAHGWTPIMAMGTEFEGGVMRVRALALRMWFGGGACVYIRGGVLHHEIEEFSGGQRVSIAHFCHASVWKFMGIVLKSLGVRDN